MRITLKANVVQDNYGTVELDFPNLQVATLDLNLSELKMREEGGAFRTLSHDEERDLDDALGDFFALRMARALRKYILV
jgi:hypothetical protein